MVLEKMYEVRERVEGEPANQGSHGRMAVKPACACTAVTELATAHHPAIR